MRSLQDTIYNWLTIKLVFDKRPHDIAAKDTFMLFQDILTDEHKVKNLEVIEEDDLYIVHYTKDDKSSTYRFPKELAEMLITQIEQEPEKY